VESLLDIQAVSELNFGANGLLPVVAQDIETHEVLMLAYANSEAISITIETGFAHYYSRSRNKLWMKGETSGNVQHVEDIRRDCDSDALLYLVKQDGPACHTHTHSCFDYDFDGKYGDNGSVLLKLQDIVADRKAHPREGSYTNYLYTKGLDKILKKVGEESAEVIIASKNREASEIKYETADLIYHLTVLLTETGLTWADIFEELKKRM
jgi:phosphoribosyl-ATP pyrophosphohydrolase/phosphoribosyl-AMP cyclohydrolase